MGHCTNSKLEAFLRINRNKFLLFREGHTRGESDIAKLPNLSWA
ncbi:hypothetical protein [Rubritalea tangerina]